MSVSPSPRHKLLRTVMLAIALLTAAAAQGEPSLADRYQQLKAGAGAVLPGTAISLVSFEQKGLLSADVTSLLPYPFETVAPALSNAENWCQFMPLHFNIKACAHEARENGEVLTLYSGRKIYQTPEESYAIAYRFDVAHLSGEQLSLHLHADSGPAGTRDYVIDLDAMKVKEGTLLHIRSSYRSSMTSALLTRGYLSTAGRDKIGFTLVTENGQSHPVQGVRGVIERNVMRYQLAIDAFLGTQMLPAASRHEAALVTWFRHNDSYPRQLHEMTEQEYLEIKGREWSNQQKLQQAMDEKLHVATMH